MAEKSINLATEEYVNNAVIGLTDKVNKIAELVDTPPVYKAPSLRLSISNNIITHNEESTINISPIFTQNDAGEISHYILKKDNEILLDVDILQDYNDTVILNHNETISYTAIVSYKDGPIKYTLLGNAYPETSIKSGEIVASNTIKGYAQSFIGVASEDDEINIVSRFINTKKGYECNLALVNQRSVYMYPSTYGELKNIKDANGFEYIDSYAKTIVTYDEVEYYAYILIDPVTITSFKQIFS